MKLAQVVSLKKNKKKILFFSIFSIVLLPHYVLSTSPPQILEQLQHEIRNIFEIAKPSVVTISLISSHSYTISKGNGFFTFLNGGNEERTLSYQNICSGLIYNKDGYVITKSCLVRKSDKFKITLHDGTQYEPEFIGQDYATGIVVLKINSAQLQPSTLGNSDDIGMGSWITIIGNSMGTATSLSFGMVNENYKNEIFEVSATVNPGNNGSPVFDIHGNVIGIVIAQVENSRRLNFNNMLHEGGMVLSINKIRGIADQIIQSYKEQSGWIGIQIDPDTTQPHSVVISRVVANSPAAKARLREEDILEKYNNNTIKSARELGELIKATTPGNTVPVSFLRGNVRLNVFVTVGRKEPYIERNFTLSRDYRDEFLKNFKTVDVRKNHLEMTQIRNEINRLEQQLFYLKSLINKSNTR